LQLVDTLSAYGRWAAKYSNQYIEAMNYLENALSISISAGYLLQEPPIRVGLGWAHLAVGDIAEAKAEALYAKQMSENMGYYWGKKDAEEILDEIDKASL
jgi:uncharacterized protein YbjT (DUF2867 family)